MKITSKEHYELIEQFEKDNRGRRLDKEKDKSLWEKGSIYQDGEVNKLFIAYRLGYSYAKSIFECEVPDTPPKLTAEELARRGIEWPEWAGYAALTSYGSADFFETMPKLNIITFCPEIGSQHCEIPGKWDASDWKNSLIRRPEKKAVLPDWCKVGAWVYLDGRYGKIKSIGNWLNTENGSKGFACKPLNPNLREARLRPWTFEEAPISLKVKVDDPYETGFESCTSIVCDLIDELSHDDNMRDVRFKERDCIYWEDSENKLETGRFISAKEMMEDYEQLDGSPCGILEHREGEGWMR